MRVFIAVDLDAQIRKALSRAQDALRAAAPKLRHVDPSSVHLTLRFLGEIDPRRITEIAGALRVVASQTAPFEVDVSGLGRFDDRRGRIRIVWAGVRDEDDALSALQTRIELAMEGAGFPREGRPFSPHLTLARAKVPVAIPRLTEEIQAGADTAFGQQSIEEIVVYESTLTREGPIYNAVSRHALEG
ncbi:MAG TPA: RNA 2',3'-cyclic phosphodiesterase [Phycisphaerae bacterium]|nr:RNA 2',3'-cyclic phosphodiesterase [Phycisphaerae bacterium]HRW51256.1 RNA 2',3'-cyclic phosphodiesterase [Phycisphaerae bacterium]